MKSQDIIKIYLKTLVAGSFVSQLVFAFYIIFFEHFNSEDLIYFFPLIIADVIFSFIILFIPFFISMLFAFDSESKATEFNYKKHHIFQVVTVVFLGFFPLLKEMIETNDFNLLYIFGILHLLVTYLIGFLIIENVRLKIIT